VAGGFQAQQQENISILGSPDSIYVSIGQFNHLEDEDAELEWGVQDKQCPGIHIEGKHCLEHSGPGPQWIQQSAMGLFCQKPSDIGAAGVHTGRRFC
jgi:hypothetical protein